MKTIILAASLLVATAGLASAQSVNVDPAKTVTLTYGELTALFEAETARLEAQRAQQRAEAASRKVREAFMPAPAADAPAK